MSNPTQPDPRAMVEEATGLGHVLNDGSSLDIVPPITNWEFEARPGADSSTYGPDGAATTGSAVRDQVNVHNRLSNLYQDDLVHAQNVLSDIVARVEENCGIIFKESEKKTTFVALMAEITRVRRSRESICAPMLSTTDFNAHRRAEGWEYDQ